MRQSIKVFVLILIFTISIFFSACTPESVNVNFGSNELNFDIASNSINSIFKTDEMVDFTKSACDYFNKAVELKGCIIQDKYLKHLDEYDIYSQMDEISNELNEQEYSEYKSQLNIYVLSIQYHFATINTNIPFMSEGINVYSEDYEEEIESDLQSIDELLQQAYSFLLEANVKEWLFTGVAYCEQLPLVYWFSVFINMCMSEE